MSCLIQPRPILTNLDDIRVVERFLLLNLFHEKQKPNDIGEIEVFPFRWELVSTVVHSGQTVALLC